MITFIRSIYEAEPVRITAIIASVVVFIFAKVGIVVPATDVLTALAYVVPILLSAEVARTQVSPSPKIIASAPLKVVPKGP